jgi:hypothetical protein
MTRTDRAQLRRAPAAGRVGASAAPDALAANPLAAAVVALQRTIGNRAVQRLAQRADQGHSDAPGGGAASGPRVLARRRTFNDTDLWVLFDDAAKSGDQAVLDAGFNRMWQHAIAYIYDPRTPTLRKARGLAPANPDDVRFIALTGHTQTEFAKLHPDPGEYAKALGDEFAAFSRLPDSLQVSHLVAALLKLYPELELTGSTTVPEKLTATGDKANVKAMADAADKVFAAIADGSHDADIAAVFGAKNVSKAKTKYASARRMLAKLEKAGSFETDRSGFTREAGVGGSTPPGGPIKLMPDMIAKPTEPDSVVTLIHESVHAGNADVVDQGYVGSPGFLSAPEVLKLTNAAHFEVVPSRILEAATGTKLSSAFDGQTFVPAAGTGASVATVKALTLANATLETAWNAAQYLHTVHYVWLFNHPFMWDDKATNAHDKDYLPFWSKVENLTIHKRLAHIDPKLAGGSHKSSAPVTEIDLALSEEVVRNVGDAMDAVPTDEKELAQLISQAKLAAPDVARRTATPEAERDLIIELVCGISVGGITGTGARDLLAVQALAAAGKDAAKIEKKRPVTDFPDLP